MITALKSKLSRYSLRTKLILASLLLILVPMTVLGAVSSATLMLMAGQQSEEAYRRAMQQTVLNLSKQVENVETTAWTACSRSRLIFVFRHLMHDRVTMGGEYDYYQEIQAVKDSVLSQTAASRVRIALRASATFIKPYFDLFPEEILLEEPAWQDMGASSASRWFAPGSFSESIVKDSKALVYCAEVKDIYAANEHQGYLMVIVSPGVLFSALTEETLPEGACVLVHQGEELFYSAGDPDALQTASRLLAGEESGEDRQNYRLVRGEVAASRWEVVMLVPQDALLEQSRSIRSFIFVLALVLSGIAVLFAVWYTGGMNRRLRDILFALRRMEEGEFGRCMPVEGHDEYATLMEAVNAMSVRTEELLESLRLAQKQTQQAEMRALYEQINPHFIYNTLDVIRWLALRNQTDSVGELVGALIGYLRLTLNHGKELTTVGNEIEEIGQYMRIMNYRYRNCIDFAAEAEEEVRMQPVLKLILQPLVENAVLHGVMSRPDRQGWIRVRAFREGEALIYTVEDNGAGMPQEKADRLTCEDMQKDTYGIYSVTRRLKTYYGEESGLTLRSAPGEGCLVRVRIFLGRGVTIWKA